MFSKSLSLTLALIVGLLILAFNLVHYSNNHLRMVVHIAYAVLFSCFAFFIFKKEKISNYRSIIFIVMAISFIIVFRFKLIFFGSSRSPIEVPYCHIAMSTTILNFLHDQWIAATTKSWAKWGIYSLGFLWLLATLSLGGGWCSWVCFYGGIDEGFSKILKKPIIKLYNISNRWKSLGLGILIFVILISFAKTQPIFCLWMCPLKLAPGFLDIDPAVKLIQTIIFLAVGIIFLVVLPVLSKKRTFCGLICPFGAWQSIIGRINPYRVSIEKDKCIQCGKCVIVCPVFAINDKSISEHKILNSCVLCGACKDVCPKDAVDFTVLNVSSKRFRLYYLMSALVIMGLISSIFVPEAIISVIKIWEVSLL